MKTPDTLDLPENVAAPDSQEAVPCSDLLGCSFELFSIEEVVPWRAEWQDMPEYDVQDLAPKYQVIINFACAADVEEFGRLIGQTIKANNGSKQLQSFWHPEQEIGRMTNKRYIEVKK